MSARSTIEWTDASWNPVRGCKKITPGCKHCYAETFAERWRGVEGNAYELGFDPREVPEKLLEPFAWASPRRVFVNSMSDLFQDNVSTDFIARVWSVMKSANWHTYQVLTKRAVRMRELVSAMHPLTIDDAGERRPGAPVPSHIWLGVSVEDQRYGIPRVEHLRQTPAAVRFLSVEPLLEDLGTLNLDGIDWVIVGGESGHGARPLQADWVRSIRDQCHDAGVDFFFKQWGGVRKKKAGRELDGRTHDAMPSSSSHAYPGRTEKKRRLCVLASDEADR